MKRFFSSLFLGILMVANLSLFAPVAMAEKDTTLPFLPETVNVYKENSIPGPSQANPAGDGIETLQQLILEDAFGYLKIIIAVVAILYITIIGIRMVTDGANEETQTKAKKAMTYTVIGLVMISAGQEFAKIFDQETRTLLETPSEILKRVKLFDQSVEVVIIFIKYVIGAFATIMAVRSGFQLVVQGDDEEATTKHKKSLAYSAGGLVLIYIGDIFINRVFYRIDKTVYTGISGVQIGTDPYEGVRQIVGITNLVVSFVGPLAVLMLMIGAVMYITSRGEEEQMEKAKRLLIATVIGIIIVYGAFAIVSTFLAGKLPIESV